MSIRPATFFAAAASRADLLVELFHRGSGVSEGDLLELLERHRTEQDASVAYQLEQLRKLRILEPSPAGDATYQLTFPVQQLLGFLLRQQRLTGAAVLQAYIDEMASLTLELQQATAEADADRVTRALRDLEAPLERLRHDSESNRERLTSEALEAKADPAGMSARARFERINHLWHRYLVPLRDVLDPDGAMDATLDELRTVLVQARQRFAARAALERGIRAAARILTRLRRSVFRDHDESVREVEPLYARLRRDSRLSRGASRALELLRTEGWSSLPVEDWLALPKRERSPRFSDAALESFLVGLRGYTPTRPGPIATPASEEVPARLDRSELTSHLRESVPIDDVLGWLVQHYEDRGPALVLRAYGWIYTGELGAVTVEDNRPAVRHAVAGLELRARPVGLREVAL